MSLDYAAIEQTLAAEYNCVHQDQELRRKVFSKSTRIVMMCTTCGRSCGSVPKSALDAGDISDIPLFDDDLARIYRERKKAKRRDLVQEAKTQEKMDFWRRYDEYLKSDAWRAKRERVYRRERIVQNTDTPACQECYEKPGEVCHHTVYHHVFDERCHEMVLLCWNCHNRYHGVPDPPWSQ